MENCTCAAGHAWKAIGYRKRVIRKNPAGRLQFNRPTMRAACNRAHGLDLRVTGVKLPKRAHNARNSRHVGDIGIRHNVGIDIVLNTGREFSRGDSIGNAEERFGPFIQPGHLRRFGCAQYIEPASNRARGVLRRAYAIKIGRCNRSAVRGPSIGNANADNSGQYPDQWGNFAKAIPSRHRTQRGHGGYPTSLPRTHPTTRLNVSSPEGRQHHVLI